MLVLLLLLFALHLQDPRSHLFVLHEAEVHGVGDDSEDEGVLIQQADADVRLAQQAGQRQTADLVLWLSQTEEEEPDSIVEEDRLMNESQLVEVPVLGFGLRLGHRVFLLDRELVEGEDEGAAVEAGEDCAVGEDQSDGVVVFGERD